MQHRRAAANPTDRGRVRLNLLGRTGPLHGQHAPTWCGEWKAPARQSVQRCNRSGGHDVSRFHVKHRRPRRDLLGPRPHHLNSGIQSKIKCNGLQEGGTPSQRLNQHHADLGASDCQHNPWQSSTRTDIYYIVVQTNERSHRRTVEDVPIPHSGGFARADQSSDDTFGREQLGVRLGAIQTCTEHPLGHGAELVGQWGNSFRHPQTLPTAVTAPRRSTSGHTTTPRPIGPGVVGREEIRRGERPRVAAVRHPRNRSPHRRAH